MPFSTASLVTAGSSSAIWRYPFFRIPGTACDGTMTLVTPFPVTRYLKSEQESINKRRGE